MFALLTAILVALSQSPETLQSAGNPIDGKLFHPTALPLRGDHHVVSGYARENGLTHGTDYLVGAVLDMAASVAKKYPGSVLRVGDLSRRGGGDIPVSRSHASGRDVDIAYLARDGEGRPLGPVFDRFHPDGSSKTSRERFLDVPRNWELIKAFMDTTEAVPANVFLDPGIKSLILEHARHAGEPDAVVARADELMSLPRYALQHDSHIHFRVLCSPADALGGCKEDPVEPPRDRGPTSRVTGP